MLKTKEKWNQPGKDINHEKEGMLLHKKPPDFDGRSAFINIL
jgi:hypothetical protein